MKKLRIQEVKEVVIDGQLVRVTVLKSSKLPRRSTMNVKGYGSSRGSQWESEEREIDPVFSVLKGEMR